MWYDEKNKAAEVILMEIYVRVKALGKRRDVLVPTAYAVPDGIRSLRQLLLAIAEKEVDSYNRRLTEPRLLPLLTPQEVEAQAQAGKVGFGELWSEKRADGTGAGRNVIRCFQDGLVRVLMEEQELTELDAPLEIPAGAVFTFIRLAFLTGRLW